jgi:hypothetical protein
MSAHSPAIAEPTGAEVRAALDHGSDLENRPAEQAKIAQAAAAAAAPFGPVFQTEFALARHAAHTLELPDCQTRYREFRRGTDPAFYPDAFACFQSLVERQPNLAHAWAGLAMLYADEHLFHASVDGNGDSLDKARTAVRTARRAAARPARRRFRARRDCYAKYGRVSSSETCQSRAAIAGSFWNALGSAGLQSTK